MPRIPRRAIAVGSISLALGVLLPVASSAGGPAPAAPVSASWPVYGHDLANSRDAGAGGPSPAQAASLKPAWTFNSSNGDFTGTPVVADGVLVAGTNLGSVYAL